jgi:hypothetical protein
MNMNLSNLKNLKLSDINKTWRITGLVVLGVGALAYPAFRLYKFIMKRRQDSLAPSEEGNGATKTFSPAYRGHHKPHHRKAESNSNLNEGIA